MKQVCFLHIMLGVIQGGWGLYKVIQGEREEDGKLSPRLLTLGESPGVGRLNRPSAKVLNQKWGLKLFIFPKRPSVAVLKECLAPLGFNKSLNALLGETSPSQAPEFCACVFYIHPTPLVRSRCE